MTQEQQPEWNYRYQERFGILIDGVRPATLEEKEIARREADEAVAEIYGIEAQ